MSEAVEPMYDPALFVATLPGCLVWERDPFEGEAPEGNERALRGGTVVEFCRDTHVVTFVAGTPLIRSKKAQVIQVNTGTLRLEELAPRNCIGPDDRPYDRVKVARKLLRAVGESGAQARTGWDERLVRWATALWEPYSVVSIEDDCRSKVCRLFGPPCRSCEDEATLAGFAPSAVEDLYADADSL